MRKVHNRLVFLCLTAVLCVVITGCIAKPLPTEHSETPSQEPALSYSLTYYYNIYFTRASGDYVSQENLHLLNNFGKSESITPATPVTETHTNIPKFENNAKGTDPICMLLPDLDISKYRICSWRDTETGETATGWCRIIGGLFTE